MMEPNYTFSANARPIVNRQKYRDIPLEPTQQNCNIAVDPRIQRGSTHNRMNAMTEKITAIPSYPKRTVKRSPDEEFDALHRDGYSESLVQTDDFDGVVKEDRKEEHVGVQTDPYHEKPIIHKKPAPLRAVGIKTDVPSTSLFDFEVQVQPVVATLCQKALTQAAMEYQEEEELSYMRMYLKAFQHTAQKESDAIKRLEEAEIKKFQEKDEIVQKKLKIEEQQLELRSKVLARGFAEWFVWDIQNDVMDNLHRSGYFYDEIEREIEGGFLPWITSELEAAVAKPSIPKALAAKAMEVAAEMCEEQSNQNTIDLQIERDSEEVRQNKLMRLMIAEDFVAGKIRQAKKRGSYKKKKENEDDDQNNEEEEENGESANTPSENTNDTGSNLNDF